MRVLVAVLALTIPVFAAFGLSQAPASEQVQVGMPKQTQLPDDGFGY
jgi:hypothetical protein